MQPITTLVKRFGWVHTGLGLCGNLTFFVGSICFLYDVSKREGIWLFIVGSFLMLIGSLGNLLTKLRHDTPHRPHMRQREQHHHGA